MRPRIGITTFVMQNPRKPFAAVSRNYERSVQKAGGTPLLLSISTSKDVLDDYISIIDGLLITGGEKDVSPQFYGENPIKELEMIFPERDECEMYLFKKALEKRIPVLGICRGMQLMNVAAGGSLYQDIFSQLPDALGHLPLKMPVDELYHQVNLEPESTVSKIFGTTRMMINSFHHQAVKKVADSFTITARSDDNIIEAIEHRTHPFALGIQWHPEDLTARHPQFRKLFDAFIAQAQRKN